VRNHKVLMTHRNIITFSKKDMFSHNYKIVVNNESKYICKLTIKHASK